jgi:Na+/proline symporter
MGGMWSVAITDFLQMIIIVVGMLFIGWVLADMAGGVGTVIQHASDAGKLHFLPKPETREILWFIAAAITMMLGSIPQQDVFQRVASAKDENVSRNSAVLGGALYFLFAFVPIFLAYSAVMVAPDIVAKYIDTDSQMILPTLIMTKVPVIAQVMFFGALLSAIKSTASATLLAPSVTFSENILKEMIPNISDKQFLLMMRIVVVVFTVIVTLFALNTESGIFQMVENAYKVTLVAAFVPLAFGVYWKRANTFGATAAMLMGFSSWVLLEIFAPEGFWPPQLVGVVLSLVGMLVGSYLRPAPPMSPASAEATP